MTLFEYISVATSLILSFSLARTLTNLTPIFTAERRYWVHTAWVLGLLVYHATLFWQLWLYQSVVDWTLFKFAVLLIGPIMLLVGVSLLVPIEPVTDYRAYFESIRGPFYSILIVMQLQPLVALYSLFNLPIAFHPMLLSNLIFAAVPAIGLIGRKASIDMGLVCIFVAGIIGGLFTINDHEAMMESVKGLMQ